MAEICLICYNIEHNTSLTPADVVLGWDLCEWCGDAMPCIIRYRGPIAKKLYKWRYRHGDPWVKAFDEIAEEYQKLNEQLQNDPDAAVPVEVEERALRMIEEAAARMKNGEVSEPVDLEEFDNEGKT